MNRSWWHTFLLHHINTCYFLRPISPTLSTHFVNLFSQYTFINLPPTQSTPPIPPICLLQDKPNDVKESSLKDDNDDPLKAGRGGGGGVHSSHPHLPLARVRDLSDVPDSPYAEFTLCMALCNTVIIEGETGAVQAESPDEKVEIII